MLEKVFKLKQNNTDIHTEVMAGITTFMTMAYILAINPTVLGDAGMDKTAVLIATCLASIVGNLCMAFLANLPFALSAGLGLNAYFAYTVVLTMGYSWQMALFAVFVEGVIFIILSITNVREAIFNSIPMNLKRAVSVGIGLFIAFIGLQHANLVVYNKSTLVSAVNFSKNFHSVGITALLSIIGLLVISIFYTRGIKGAILTGIVFVWVFAIFFEAIGVYVPDPDLGMYSVIPREIISFDFSALGKTFGKCFSLDFAHTNFFDFVVVVMSFLFVDIFDTLGTLIGVSTKAGMLDKDGKLPAIRPALLSDAIATTAGAILGTSTTSTFVESAAGVAEGGRTGLTAIVTGALFFLSIVFAPLFIVIPSFATAPALIFVGFLMFSAITDINFDNDNLYEAIPAYLAIIAMPLFYSIAEGIGVGVISYVILNATGGRAKRVHPIMYIVAVLFVLKYIFL